MLEPLATARDRALATEAGGDALASLLHEAVRLQAQHRGLADALEHSPAGLELRDQLRAAAIEIVTPLVDRAHRDGELRADLGALDLLIVMRLLAVLAATPELAEERVRRYVDIVRLGLRAS